MLALWDTGPAFGARPLDGQRIFRFDAFGDEQLWTDTLRLREAIQTVTPATALAVGVKVDVDALPPPLIKALMTGQLNVNDPRVTRRLLEMNAIVGVVAKVTGDDRVRRLGVTCALCHSTVDDSLASGIGKRLDGWPNLDLDVGTIVSLSPALDDSTKTEFRAWGPGRYDPRHHVFDGLNIVPLNTPSLPVVIPPAYGLQAVGFETFTGDGPISYWNSYVAVTQLGGHGSFSDSRIGVTVSQKPDRVVVRNSADRRQLQQYAARSATGLYRTTPLRALWQHPPYFHGGSAPDLLAVVNHYDRLSG